jgi:hypothetical protein
MNAVQKRFCINHPQRAAIGVCVMTLKPICGECSTRYEGVNYSREGLRLLQQQRGAAEAVAKGGGKLGWLLLSLVLTPVAVYLTYLSYIIAAETLINLIQWRS